MRTARIAGTIVLILWCSVVVFSSSVSPSSSRPADGTSVTHINEIYAPFDSLYTDIADYIWPTNASTVITSSFGDFRRTHFHEGIDISTNNQRGYPVYASRDGYVFRIRYSPYGYGKMLYVRHPDGFVTTYAHLQKFNNGIHTYIKQLQKQRHRYSFDIDTDSTQFIVKKGDVIAYTGDTGIGSAHLHFEVRDSAMNPVNPFLLPLFSSLLKDNSPPVFQSIAFSPLAHPSIIQGKRRAWVTNVKRVRADEYRLEGTVRLTGSIGIGVKATDGTEGTHYKTGIHKYEFYVDDRLIFTSVKNRIPESEAKEIAMYYDWGLLRTKHARFEKLYVVPGSRLPFYNRLPEGAGAIETSAYDEGEHNLKIIAYDLSGNQSVLTLRAIFNHPPDFTLQKIGEQLILARKNNIPITTLTVWSKSAKSNGWNTKRISAEKLQPAELGFIVPVDLKKYDAVKVVAENRFGTQSDLELFYSDREKGNASPIHLQKEFIGDHLYLTLRSASNFTEKPHISISSMPDPIVFEPYAVNDHEYLSTIPLATVGSGKIHLVIKAKINGQSITKTDEFSLFAFKPESGGTIATDNGQLSISFPSNALYQPLYCRIERTAEGYSLHPQETVLAKPAVVTYATPLTRTSGKVGLYFSDGTTWGILRTELQSNPQALKARIFRTLGSFAIFSDVERPGISNVKALYQRGKLLVSFRILDKLSGIDIDKIQIKIDDDVIVGEYDPYAQKVVYAEPYPLSKGTHLVSIEAADRAGNVATAQKTLKISSL